MRQSIVLVVILALAGCGGPVAHRIADDAGNERATGNLVRGKQDGRWEYRHPSGALEAAGDWQADRQTGYWSWYYEDQQLKQHGHYRSGMRQGFWQYLHPGGATSAAGAYSDDRQDGWWRYADSGGNPVLSGVFDQGSRQLWWEWNGGASAGIYLDGNKIGPWRENGKQVDYPWPNGERKGDVQELQGRGGRLIIRWAGDRPVSLGYASGLDSCLVQMLDDRGPYAAGRVDPANKPVGRWVVRLDEPAMHLALDFAQGDPVPREWQDVVRLPQRSALDYSGPLEVLLQTAWQNRQKQILANRPGGAWLRSTGYEPAAIPEPMMPEFPVEVSPLAEDPQQWTVRDHMKAAMSVAVYSDKTTWEGGKDYDYEAPDFRTSSLSESAGSRHRDESGLPGSADSHNPPMAGKQKKIRNKPLKERDVIPALFKAARADRPTGAAFCSLYGQCGGCDLQDHPYDEQLAIKLDVFQRIIAHFSAQDLFAEVEPVIIPSPSPTGYRQRMECTVAFGKCGLRKKGDWRTVVHMSECHLIAPPALTCLHRAYDLCEAQALKHYNYISHKGYLRYLTVRHTSLGQTMLTLTTKSGDHAAAIETVARTLIDEGVANSVIWQVNDTMTDRATGEITATWGQETIEERIADLTFPIAPQSFFQANQAVTAQAYRKIRDWLRQASPGLGLDLYSGVGTIAALLAQCCERVIAVENLPENIALFHQTCDRNGLANIDLVDSDVETWLLDDPPQVDALVINPPRIGLRERGSHVVRNLGAKRIAYMSCNPMSLVRDLRILCEAYRIESVDLFDMFPQTRHFETVVLLERR